MIHVVLIFNTIGKPRLLKFYDHNYPPDLQMEVNNHVFRLIHQRKPNQCHFIETDILDIVNGKCSGNSPKLNDDIVLLYRQYATLYIVFGVDKNENELAILDLIQVFVEAMDRCFEAVCELDLIFNMNKIHYILDEIIVGGLVMDTNLDEILQRYNEKKQLQSNSDADLKTMKTLAKIRQQIDLEGRLKKIQNDVKSKLKKP